MAGPEEANEQENLNEDQEATLAQMFLEEVPEGSDGNILGLDLDTGDGSFWGLDGETWGAIGIGVGVGAFVLATGGIGAAPAAAAYGLIGGLAANEIFDSHEEAVYSEDSCGASERYAQMPCGEEDDSTA
ncbi:hypothetical protein [Gloeobacter violaceus]|uniref:Gll2604 protein n=1 Tax=Gloeobacter violaceus (strain ATCC 29082 / PCC 7421) TaxID=251221 RepID=Q7NHD3_GLOVI|nr:hypothetical protein [Gloeobacter violaceus]BAC90545.1 gll2604 [Gloeobacter violaceus PCC 7421]